MLGKADRMIILANNARTHETLRNHILPHEIPRAEKRESPDSSFFLHNSTFRHPSLPPDPLTPRRPSAF